MSSRSILFFAALFASNSSAFVLLRAPRLACGLATRRARAQNGRRRFPRVHGPAAAAGRRRIPDHRAETGDLGRLWRYCCGSVTVAVGEPPCPELVGTSGATRPRSSEMHGHAADPTVACCFFGKRPVDLNCRRCNSELQIWMIVPTELGGMPRSAARTATTEEQRMHLPARRPRQQLRPGMTMPRNGAPAVLHGAAGDGHLRGHLLPLAMIMGTGLWHL